MKALLLLTLLMNLACTTMPDRQIASDDVVALGEIDPGRSSLKLFPSNDEQLFVLELRDKDKRRVDIESSDLELREGHKLHKLNLRRLNKGHYLFVTHKPIVNYSKVELKVQNKKLAHNLTTAIKTKIAQSRLEIVEQRDHEILVRLTLKDASGRGIASTQDPEIILEGMGELSRPEPSQDGSWEFRVHYPEMNQILYLSVRSNGLLLERILRFHHVEK